PIHPGARATALVAVAEPSELAGDSLVALLGLREFALEFQEQLHNPGVRCRKRLACHLHLPSADVRAAENIRHALASKGCSITSESPSRTSRRPSASTAPSSPRWAPSRVTRTPRWSIGRTGPSGRRTASTR